MSPSASSETVLDVYPRDRFFGPRVSPAVRHCYGRFPPVLPVAPRLGLPAHTRRAPQAPEKETTSGDT
jgi:hypothetical protein